MGVNRKKGGRERGREFPASTIVVTAERRGGKKEENEKWIRKDNVKGKEGLPFPVKTMYNFKKEMYQQMKQQMDDISSLGTYQLLTMGEPLPQVEHQSENPCEEGSGHK